MLRMRICRGDGVIWANFHPCVPGAAGQPNYWGLLAITAFFLLESNRLKQGLRGGVKLRGCRLAATSDWCLFASVLQVASPSGINSSSRAFFGAINVRFGTLLGAWIRSGTRRPSSERFFATNSQQLTTLGTARLE